VHPPPSPARANFTLMTECTPESRRYNSVYSVGRFYTALALHDLAHEMPLSAVAAKYGATKGMLQSLQQAASTFAGTTFLLF